MVYCSRCSNYRVLGQRRTIIMISSYKETTVRYLSPKRRGSGAYAWLLPFLYLFLLSACYYRPYSVVSPAPPEASYEKPSVPITQVYFSPKKGQTTEQQSRDHYDCYNWAV